MSGTVTAGGRRVVITGLGIVSSLGHDFNTVSDSLRYGRSGIRHEPKWQELAFRCTVAGNLGDVEQHIAAAKFPKSKLRAMNEAARYCALAARQAIDMAAFDDWDQVRRGAACIVGTGLSGLVTLYENSVNLYRGQADRVDPYTVVRTMASCSSATIANTFGLNGRSYSISSACATSAHNIGNAWELIRAGACDVALAGGGEEINYLIGGAFNGMRTVLSSGYNGTPERASRPFDRDRDGIVMTGGAGIVVLESLESAVARGADILAEVLGFGATSDGYDMVLPEPEGRHAARCMDEALKVAAVAPARVDYINAHATGTVAGDLAEIQAIRTVFGDKPPLLSSTKSLGGHAIGAAGAHEVIHCLAMLHGGFVAGSANIDTIDPDFDDMPIVRETQARSVDIILTNNFGFGGTNASLLLGRYRS